jgi:hypothetical protein
LERPGESFEGEVDGDVVELMCGMMEIDPAKRPSV